MARILSQPNQGGPQVLAGPGATPAPQDDQQQPGFVQSTVRDIASPFLRLGANAVNTVKAVENFGKPTDTSAPVNYGSYLGSAKPVGQTGNFINDAEDSLGTGTEIASDVLGGGEGAGAAKSTLKGLLVQGAKQGAKTGAIAGGLGGIGRGLQAGDGVGGAAVQGVEQGVGGAALGAGLGVGGALASKAAQTVIRTPAGKVLQFIQHPISTTKSEVQSAVTGKVPDAIDQLENKYQELAGTTQKTKKILNKNEAATAARDKAGTTGRTAARTLAESGIVPKQEGSRLTTVEQAAQYRQGTKPLQEALTKAIGETRYATAPVSIDALQSSAVSRVVGQGIPEGDKLSLINGIKSEFGLLREKYGDSMTIEEMNSAKGPYWGGTKFDSTKPFQGDAYYQVGKSLQKGVETAASKGGFDDVAQLNREVGDRLEAAKFLASLDGKVVKGGRLQKYVFQGIGASLGKTIPGKIVGALGGDAVANMLISTSVAGPAKRLILRNLESKDPAAYESTIKWLQEQNILRDVTPRLSAGPKLGEKGNPIITPPPQDTSGDIGSGLAKKTFPHQNPKTGKMEKTFTSELASPPKAEGGVPGTQTEEEAKQAADKFYADNKDELLKGYIAKFGKEANSDNAKKLFKPAGYVGTNSPVVQGASSKLAKQAWDYNLAKNVEPDALILGGGSGVGKTSTLAQLDPEAKKTAAAVLDSNSSNLDVTKKRIQEAITAGKNVKFDYVYAPLERSFESTVNRGLHDPSEMGRLVPISVIADNHAGALKTVRGLFSDPEMAPLIRNGRLRIRMLDNSGEHGKAKFTQLANLTKVVYNREKDIASMTRIAKKMYEEGKISKEQYAALNR